MKALKWAGWGVLAGLGVWVGGLSLVSQQASYPLTAVATSPVQMRGVMHVHTEHSDGRGSVEDVAQAAKIAGLGFVILADHNLEVIPRPRYVDGVLMIYATELSTASGHVVALGISQAISKEDRLHRPFEAIAAQGGKAVLAHPVQRRNPWRDWRSGHAADGYEMYSGDTFFREALGQPSRLACVLGSIPGHLTHAAMSMVYPMEAAQAPFLALSEDKDRFVVCAQDAHGSPPYGWVLPLMSMHLAQNRLSEDPELAASEVLKALFTRQALCVFDALGDASGFAIEGLSDERTVELGAELKVRLPPLGQAKARIRTSPGARVLADGVSLRAEKEGVFLLEVQLLGPGCGFGQEWKPWIVPNPIRVVARQAPKN